MSHDNSSRSGGFGHRLTIAFTINGRGVTREIRPALRLIDLIRDDLGLKGTKPGCLEGECGACTVLVDGDAVNSCLYLAANIDGKSVTTIEGLSAGVDGPGLDPVQRAVVEHGAVQCGFCTSGMIMAIESFKRQCDTDGVVPNRERIKKSLEGNLCRCTGYKKIIDAVQSLFEQVQGADGAS
ncbi:MAG: (2Fe-2S)-binding protein [Candidatus Krumholzibacteria bacterium]|nr:(2Fe-2S)-binding protein [Candidatus Krumholzibacteria bacterium]